MNTNEYKSFQFITLIFMGISLHNINSTFKRRP